MLYHSPCTNVFPFVRTTLVSQKNMPPYCDNNFVKRNSSTAGKSVKFATKQCITSPTIPKMLYSFSYTNSVYNAPMVRNCLYFQFTESATYVAIRRIPL